MDVRLVMFGRDGKQKDFPILNRRTIIGRGRECDLRVPVLTVSRKHCQLVSEGGGLRIKDLSSSNGTFVNNRRVEEAKLNAGDRVVVGPAAFTVQIDGQPEEIHPSRPAPHEEADKTGLADTSVSLAAQVDQELDPITALENLVAETLTEDEEEEEQAQEEQEEDEGKL